MPLHRPRAMAVALAIALAAYTAPGAAFAMPDSTPFTYPPTRQAPVTDHYHGEAVVDPYRWLEDSESAEVKAWVSAQNAYTRQRLDAMPHRGDLNARLKALVSAPREGVPQHAGDRWFFTRHDGHSPHARLMVEEAGHRRVLLDPNTMSADGTVSLDYWEVSPHGEKLVYGTSENGSEQSTAHVLDVATGAVTDVIPQCKYGSFAWLSDASGFYYTRFAGDTGHETQQIFFHRLGADVSCEPVVFSHPGGAEVFMSVGLSRDDRWVTASVGKGKGNELYVLDRRDPKGFVPVATGFEATRYGDIDGATMYLRTTDGAPRGRLVAVPLETPDASHWRPLVAESQAVMQYAFLAGGRLVAAYLDNAHSRLSLFGLDGKPQGDIPLPGLGTVGAISGRPEDPELHFAYSSYLEPGSVWRYRFGDRSTAVHFRPALSIDATAYEEHQVWVRSKDGTRVPMMLVHKKGLKKGAPTPTLLTAYGGFNIAMTPSFSAADFAWVERGGLLAVPGLRGGGEFGDAWHEGGMLDNKQNVFDDFFASAEYLIHEGYTDADHLGIQGGSNGGLLMGAALTQRPELFKAVVCAVPLLDMLRYHQFLIARYWVPEYGSSEDASQYRYLKAYSPYHHVTAGRAYPATLIVTGESDTRVEPLHARKMAALLQRDQGGPAPILLYVESKAGHGAGKPLDKWIETVSDTLGFLAAETGLK